MYRKRFTKKYNYLKRLSTEPTKEKTRLNYLLKGMKEKIKKKTLKTSVFLNKHHEESNLTNITNKVEGKNPLKVQLFKKKYFNYINQFILNFFQFLFKQKVHISFKKLWYQGVYVESLHKHNQTIAKIRRYTKKLKSFRFLNNFYKVL